MAHSKAPEITMTPAKSSVVAAHGYDARSKIMQVQLSSGGTYRYADVSPATYERFSSAKSIGSYFGKNIRNRYKLAGR